MKFPNIVVFLRTSQAGSAITDCIPPQVNVSDFLIVVVGLPVAAASTSMSAAWGHLVIYPAHMSGVLRDAFNFGQSYGFATANDERYLLVDQSIGLFKNILNDTYYIAIPMEPRNSRISTNTSPSWAGNLGRWVTQFPGIGLVIDLLTESNQISLYNSSICFSMDVAKTDTNQPDNTPLYFWRDVSNYWIASFNQPTELSTIENKQLYFKSPIDHINNSLCFPQAPMTWVRYDPPGTVRWSPTLYTSFPVPQYSLGFFQGMNKYNCSADLRVAYCFNGVHTSGGMLKQSTLLVR